MKKIGKTKLRIEPLVHKVFYFGADMKAAWGDIHLKNKKIRKKTKSRVEVILIAC
jgi:hypothetical protein